MRSLRLKNFRSLGDTGRVELRPLTILVGANSSGKSSFLRFFPLLRQTLEAKSASPLLWYGRYVDFGDFSQAVRRGAEPKEITIELDFPWQQTNVTSSATLREHEGKTRTVECRLSCEGAAMSMAFDSSGAMSKLTIFAGDKLVLEAPPSRMGTYTVRSSLVPWEEPKSQASIGLGNTKYAGEFYNMSKDLARAELSKALSGRVDAGVIDKLSALVFTSAEDMFRHAERLEGGAALRHMSLTNVEDFERFRAYDFCQWAPLLLDRINESLGAYGLGCVYIGPFRD